MADTSDGIAPAAAHPIWQPAATFGGVIDVSHAQGRIDWSKVPASIVLVFIKATQGYSFVDPMFDDNLAGAHDTGRLTVPYHFLTEAPIADQLDNFLGEVADPLAMRAVMVDWEVNPATSRRAPIATMEAFGTKLAGIIGRSPLAYHGMLDPTTPIIQSWPWMLPRYRTQLPGPKFLFWQNSRTLHLEGITGPVDHSIFAGTEAELRAWHATGVMPRGF